MFYNDETEEWRDQSFDSSNNAIASATAFFIVGGILVSCFAITGLIGGSFFYSQYSDIKHLPCPISSPPPVLHIFAVNLTNVLFLSAYNNSVEYGYITVSFGDGVFSDDGDIKINDGYVSVFNASSGINGWKVPSPGVYEVSTFMEFECINVDTSGAHPAPFISCGLDDNVTSAPLHGAAFINQTSGGPLNGALSNFIVDASAFIEAGNIWETPELGSVIPSIKLILTSLSMLTIIEITDVETQHISGGALIIGNNNNAIIVPNRDFSIRKLR
jgi:hypothetical protein